MKNGFAIIALLIFTFSVQSTVSAQTRTPTPTRSTVSTSPTASDSAVMDSIQRIKDLVASKVAELNLVEKRGMLGTVKSVTGTQVTIVDIHDRQRIIDVDELTKFATAKEDESFGISDIKSGDRISAVGLYNKDTRRLLAREMASSSAIPKMVSGVVSAIDEDEFTVTVVDEKGKKQVVDIERSTRTQSFSAQDELTRSGFTSIEAGQRVLVAGFDDPENEAVLNATRITHFESAPLSEELKKHLVAAAADSEVEATDTPTPRVRTSATLTPRPTR